MAEVLFYHLQRQPLEAVLPLLLEKTLQRGWRAVVQAGSAERVQSLSSAIWTWRDDAFIPHGSKADGHSGDQPIWLTEETDNPNSAEVRFFVDGARLEGTDLTALTRVVYMFDGHDPAVVETARREWKAIAKDVHDTTYWQQDESGKWQKRA